MAFNPKLTEAQWTEIERRMLDGASVRALAREFHVSETAIRKRKGSQVADMKAVANQLVSAQRALRALPEGSQRTVQMHAERLLVVYEHLGGAALYGAATAHRLAALANGKVQEIDDAAPLDAQSIEALKGVAVLTKLANESASIAVSLMAANRETLKRHQEGEPEQPGALLAELVRHLPD